MHHEKKTLSHSAAMLTAGATVGAQYLEMLPTRNVAPTSAALAALSEFDVALPEKSNAPEATLALLDRVGSPATTATAAGRFFGLVVGGALPATVGARALTTAWDQVVFSPATSAVGVKLEEVASRWLLDVLGLPKASSVGFVTGATMASFTCLAAARQEILQRAGWDVNQKGLSCAPKLRIITSDQVHVTILKALTLLGIGTDAIESVPCDPQGRLDISQLPKLDALCIVSAQAGNVNSGASDPIGDICRAAKGTGAWVHVDGAFGLWAATSDKTKHLINGHDMADSWAVDGHKWLNTPYECGLAICRNPDPVHQAMATQAPYLRIGGAAAPKDMVPEFSRAARGVEIWAALHCLGRSGVAGLVEQCCAHARALAAGLEALGFEVLNDVVLNQVVAVLRGHEDQMPALAQVVQDSGAAWFGPTQWRDTAAIRLSVSSWGTTSNDIDMTLSAIKQAKADLNLT